MHSLQHNRHPVQRVVCLAAAAFIVACGLMLCVIGAQSLERQAIVATNVRA